MLIMSSSPETGLFRDNKVNTMADNALATQWASATMVLTIKNEQAFYYLDEEGTAQAISGMKHDNIT